MDEIHVGLSYAEDIDELYFAEFLAEVREAGIVPTVEARENVPYAAFEWVIPTAIAIYIGKPFIDVFLKRAADDVAASVYPAVKGAIAKLVKRVFVKEPLSFAVVTSTEKKTADPSFLVFSVFSRTKTDRSMKFIFKQGMTVIECDTVVEEMFAVLIAHHQGEGARDPLSQQIDALTNPQQHGFYLRWDPSCQKWVVIDPLKEAKARHDQQKR